MVGWTQYRKGNGGTSPLRERNSSQGEVPGLKNDKHLHLAKSLNKHSVVQAQANLSPKTF